MRQTINTTRTSYQPNSLGGGCPFQARRREGGFVSYAEKIDARKVRARGDKFFDHFSQATLFWNSQSDPQKAHLVQDLCFHLGKVDTVAIRERMLRLLAEVDKTLGARVAEGLGLAVPRKLGGAVERRVPADEGDKELPAH